MTINCKIIKNVHGVEMDFGTAHKLMDASICEDMHNNYYDMDTDQEFFDIYCEKHFDKFGEAFELAKSNPVY